MGCVVLAGTSAGLDIPLATLESASHAFEPGGHLLTLEIDSPAADLALARVPEGVARRVPGIALAQRLFEHDWTKPFSAGRAAAGGPHFDRGRCAGCHHEAAALAQAREDGVPYRVAGIVDGHERHRLGAQANTRRLGGGQPEARVDIRHEHHTFHYPDGTRRHLRRPIAEAVDAEGRPVAVALRAAPLLFGWGLLEAVDRDMLLPFHDPHDENGDGISGRRRLVAQPCEAGMAMGIFGWKASKATLRQQVAAALENDMGVTSTLPCAAGEGELTAHELDAITTFVQYLAVPRHRRADDAPRVHHGEQLFERVGCGDCHVPVLLTAPEAPADFADARLWPYTDLMLHDMGEALAEAGTAADAAEWRTAPLWGVGLVERWLPDHGFLHDGRAATLEDAVLWHGGEAAAARKRFASLPRQDREALLAFVRAL